MNRFGLSYDAEEKIKSALIIAGMSLAVTALAVVIALVMIESGKQYQAWVNWCTVEQGGHIDSHTNYHTGVGTAVGANGQVSTVVTTSSDTTRYCLSADGRILDIR